jgi:molybdopterin-guanine dinucleotide biosynthesis protein A
LVKELSAVVLAGGRNSRMGGLDKGRIAFRGVSLALRTVRLVAGIFEEVVLVTNSAEGYPGLPEGVLVTGDRFPGQGPLAGIQAGLTRSSRQAAFCVACDMPFLSAGLIRRLARRFRELGCDVLLPRVGEEVEPLHALYHRRLLGQMERLLADGQGNSVRRLFPAARTAYLQLPDTERVRRIFTNLNTPEDVRRLCAD